MSYIQWSGQRKILFSRRFLEKGYEQQKQQQLRAIGITIYNHEISWETEREKKNWEKMWVWVVSVLVSRFDFIYGLHASIFSWERWCYCCLFVMSFYHRHLAIFMHFIFVVIFLQPLPLALSLNTIPFTTFLYFFIYLRFVSCSLSVFPCYFTLISYFSVTRILLSLSICELCSVFFRPSLESASALGVSCHFYLFIYI